MANEHLIAHTLYKKLLALYPRTFRERLGESMAQTFHDLYSERKRQRVGWLFGFVVWMFVETAAGIVQERITTVKEMSSMSQFFTNVRLPALIGLLLILPFVMLESVFVIVKGLQFDLRDALDSVVIFGFLWIGVAAILLVLLPIFRMMRAGKRTEDSAPAPRNTILADPGLAALIGVLLALPFLTVFTLLTLNIEPPLGPLKALLDNPDPERLACLCSPSPRASSPRRRSCGRCAQGAACSPTPSTWYLA
jgi:hypothetical protein